MSKSAKIALILGLMMIFLIYGNDLWAQCPMCKMSAESNLREGGTDGKGLNAGILFMLSLPYLIIGSIGYSWWRNQKALALQDDILSGSEGTEEMV